MKLGILSILMALLLCIGTVSAFSSIDYSIQASDAVVSVDMSYSNILENETMLGSQAVRLDHMDVTSVGIIMGDDTGVVLNNTLKAVPVRSCLISSGMINLHYDYLKRLGIVKYHSEEMDRLILKQMKYLNSPVPMVMYYCQDLVVFLSLIHI